MPRNNAERRTRFVSSEERRAVTKAASRGGVASGGVGGGEQDDGEAAEWEVEVAAAKMEDVTIEVSDGSEQDESGEESGSHSEEEEVAEAAAAAEEEDGDALAAWGFGGDEETKPTKPTRAPRVAPKHRRGGEMYGDLVVHFAARDCRGARDGHASIRMPSLPMAPSLLLVGPRPRPLPTAHTAEATARAARLREGIATWLCFSVLPYAPW